MIFALLVVLDIVLAAINLAYIQGNWANIIAFGVCMGGAGFIAALGLASRN